MVPKKAKDMICEAMQESGEWGILGETSIRVMVEERETLLINFKGDIKLTVNQMDPEIVFHSRRWQGYQVGLIFQFHRNLSLKDQMAKRMERLFLAQ